MRQISNLTLAGVLMATALVTACPCHADEPVGLRANHRLIVGEARGILGLAHPTVRYTSIENDGRDDYRDGSYRLSYVFNFRDGNDDGYRVIRFSFDKAGKLTEIAPGNGSTLVPAFFGGDLVLEAIKACAPRPENRRRPGGEGVDEDQERPGLLAKVSAVAARFLSCRCLGRLVECPSTSPVPGGIALG